MSTCEPWQSPDESIIIRLYNFDDQDLSGITVSENYYKLPGNRVFNHQRCSQHNIDLTHVDCVPLKAYRNIEQVVDFIDQNLNYFIENYIATINCRINDNPSEIDAYWLPDKRQVIFKNCPINGRLSSCSTLLDIVAHEFCHQLIFQLFDERSGLGNEGQPRALEESLCDIFAILVCNAGRDVSDWNWQIGHPDVEVLRDLSIGQYNMNNFGDLDHHDRSLIHSHAFYRLITYPDGECSLFDHNSAVELFSNLLNTLARIYQDNLEVRELCFTDSRDAMLEVMSLFPNHQEAILDSFDQQGIQ